jgi:preprotein translocase subunit Sec61beta
MASWGEYQSLIQLSVGLNLAFGLFDTIVAPQLDRLTEKRQRILQEIEEDPNRTVSVASITEATTAIRKVSEGARRLSAFGVYPSLGLAALATGLLVFSSENAAEAIKCEGKVAVYATFVWQVIFLTLLLCKIVRIDRKLNKVK